MHKLYSLSCFFNRDAKRPPGIAEPHVAGPVLINQSRGFVIVMSDGLYNAWSSYMDQDTRKANTEIARMVAEQIRGSQQNMDVVAKTVVDFIVSSVQATYTRSKKKECQRLDDITLMVHNLGFDISEFPLKDSVHYSLSTSPINPPQMKSYHSQPLDPNVHRQPPSMGHHPRYGHQQFSMPYHYGYPMEASIPGSHQPPPNTGYQPPLNTGYQPPLNTGYQPPLNTGHQPPPNVGYQPPPNMGYQPPPNTGYQPPPNQPHINTGHHPKMNVRPETPFVWPHVQPGVLPQSTSFGDQTNMSATSDHNVSGKISSSGSNAANQSSNYSSNHPSFYIGSTNLSEISNNNSQIQNSNASGGNTSNLIPQADQVSGRHSPQTQFPMSPQPQVFSKPLHDVVSAPITSAQPLPTQEPPLPSTAGHNAISHNQPIHSTGSSSSNDNDAATPVAEPSSKEVFSPSQLVEKPIPRLPRKKVVTSVTDDNQTPGTVVPELSYPPSDSIPPPQWTSTPTKEDNESEQKPSNRDSLDVSFKDDDMYGSEKEGEGDGTLEAPSAGEGESMVLENKPVNSQPDTEPPKSTEGNQLDQYIFNSDAEVEPELSTDEEDDDDEMGTVPTRLLSHFPSEEPANEDDNTVHSYIKFDSSFPDIDYDAL